MKYFSTFSGIGGFALAIHDVIPNAECVGFSEIDKYAKQIYLKHFPTHKDFGDITKIDIQALPDFDLLVGGSPCQDLSIAKKDRKGLQGDRSGLFYKFVEILKIKTPKYFILENVASMSKENKDKISEILGVQPVMINASLVSAQNRKRLFWANFPITQPEDRGIFLKDILEQNVDENFYVNVKNLEKLKYLKGAKKVKRIKNGFEYTFSEGALKLTQNEKSLPLLASGVNSISRTTNFIEQLKSNTIRTSGRDSGINNKHNWDTIRIGQLNKGGQDDRIYSPKGKSVNLSANGGGRGAKTGLYKTEDNVIRKLTPTECARLQCFPDDWCKNISNSQQYKCYGNAVNVEVVKHIIQNLYDNESKIPNRA